MKTAKPAIKSVNLDVSSDVSKFNTAELKEMLRESLAVSATAILRAASIIRELELRGEDIKSLRLSILPFLQRINDGTLDAGAYVKFCGNTPLVKKVACLPVPEQRRLAEGGQVKLAYMEDDAPKSMDIYPHLLSTPLINQVFNCNSIRSVKEQIKIIMEKKAVKPVEVVTPKARLNRRLGGITTNGTQFISLEELREYVRQLEGEASKAS